MLQAPLKFLLVQPPAGFTSDAAENSQTEATIDEEDKCGLTLNLKDGRKGLEL
jgi:hypothetical protein